MIVIWEAARRPQDACRLSSCDLGRRNSDANHIGLSQIHGLLQREVVPPALIAAGIRVRLISQLQYTTAKPRPLVHTCIEVGSRGKWSRTLCTLFTPSTSQLAGGARLGA